MTGFQTWALPICDVPDLLPAFSMFAMSSISEGYSIALLEAGACALPIAATRVGGNAEIVADDVNGLVVPPRPRGAGGRDRAVARRPGARLGHGPRPEEHTSELQSLMRISYAVFCLKKKNNYERNTEARPTHVHRP